MSNIIYKNIIVNNPFTPVPFNNQKNYKIDLKNSMQFGPLDSLRLAGIFRDGRIAGLIMKHLVSVMFSNMELNSCEDPSYTIIDSKYGTRYEVRVVTKGGVMTCPSYMIGASRSYNELEHEEKLKNIDYFIFIDITESPIFKFFSVPSTNKLLFKKITKKGFYSKII